MKKKLLAIFLAVAMVATMFVCVPFTALADDANILYFSMHWSTNGLFQVDTNLESVSCADFLVDGHNYDGIRPGYVQMNSADVWTFHCNGSSVGDYFTLYKGDKFTFDGVDYFLDRSYKFIQVEGSWRMQTFDLPSDEVTKYISLTSVGYATEGLAQINTDIDEVFDTATTLYEAKTNAELYIDSTGDRDVGIVTLYDNNKGLICFNWDSNFTAGETFTIKKGSVIRANGKVYVLKNGYKFDYDGSHYTLTPLYESITFGYCWGAEKVIQFNTDIDFYTTMQNFTADNFGCNIKQSGDQNFGWAGVAKDDSTGKLILSVNFNSAFTVGQSYTLSSGSLFCFSDGGEKYSLTNDITLYFNGTDWQATAPEVRKEISLAYRWGNLNTIQFNTNLPSDMACESLTFAETSSVVTEDGDKAVGWIGMDNAEGTIVLTFHFNDNFAYGQKYSIKKDSLIIFKDGSKYYLDSDMVIYAGESGWTDEKPSTPFSMTVRNSGCTNKDIQFDTTLPATTTIANFLTADNGNQITQSGSQNVGWVGMDNDNGTIVLTFHFGSEFSAGNTYKLSEGSLFNFGDETLGATSYKLSSDTEVIYAGSCWIPSGAVYKDSSVFGDVNGDSVCNLIDLVCLEKILVGKNIANNQSDLDNDKLVNADDIVIMIDYLLGNYNPETSEIDKAVVARLKASNYTGGGKFASFADVPVDGRSDTDIADYKALGFDTAILTEDYTGDMLNVFRATVSKTNEITTANPLTLSYTGYTNGKLYQFATNMPVDGTYNDFLIGNQNINAIKSSDDIVVGYFECKAIGETVYMNPVFNDTYDPGDTFTMKAGSTFTFGDITYTLDADYTITFENDYIRSLQNLKASGLKVLIRNYSNKADYFDEARTKLLIKYSDLFDGFYFNDEPFETDALRSATGQTAVATFDEINTMINWANKNFPGKFVHVNHVPITSYDHYDGNQSITNYKSFLSDYLTKCISTITGNSKASLSLDAYPFGDYTKTSGWWIFKETKYGLSETYLQSVLSAANVARDYAGDKDIVLANCIQTFVNDGGTSRTVNADEISFQLYTSMAMGVKQYEYFTYRSSSGFTGMIDVDGNKTSIYNDALTANKALKLSDVINNLNWNGTVLSSGSVNNANSKAFSSVSSIALTAGTNTGVLKGVSSTDDAMVGYYTAENGNDAYMVANYNDPHDVTGNNTVTLTFDGCTAVRVFTVQDGSLTSEIVKLSNGAYTAKIAPGSGFLIIPA